MTSPDQPEDTRTCYRCSHPVHKAHRCGVEWTEPDGWDMTCGCVEDSYLIVEQYPTPEAEQPMTPTPTSEDLAIARNIVNQLGDHFSELIPSTAWVSVRQSTNDELDAFVAGLIARRIRELEAEQAARDAGIRASVLGEVVAELENRHDVLFEAGARLWRMGGYREDTQAGRQGLWLSTASGGVKRAAEVLARKLARRPSTGQDTDSVLAPDSTLRARDAEKWWEGVTAQWQHRPLGNRVLESECPYREGLGA